MLESFDDKEVGKDKLLKYGQSIYLFYLENKNNDIYIFNPEYEFSFGPKKLDLSTIPSEKYFK